MSGIRGHHEGGQPKVVLHPSLLLHQQPDNTSTPLVCRHHDGRPLLEVIPLGQLHVISGLPGLSDQPPAAPLAALLGRLEEVFRAVAPVGGKSEAPLLLYTLEAAGLELFEEVSKELCAFLGAGLAESTVTVLVQ